VIDLIGTLSLFEEKTITILNAKSAHVDECMF